MAKRKKLVTKGAVVRKTPDADASSDSSSQAPESKRSHRRFSGFSRAAVVCGVGFAVLYLLQVAISYQPHYGTMALGRLALRNTLALVAWVLFGIMCGLGIAHKARKSERRRVSHANSVASIVLEAFGVVVAVMLVVAHGSMLGTIAMDAADGAVTVSAQVQAVEGTDADTRSDLERFFVGDSAVLSVTDTSEDLESQISLIRNDLAEIEEDLGVSSFKRAHTCTVTYYPATGTLVSISLG